MNKYLKHILTAVVCFLFVLVLNFALPRMLPGDPVAYLTGFEEEEMTEETYDPAALRAWTAWAEVGFTTSEMTICPAYFPSMAIWMMVPIEWQPI